MGKLPPLPDWMLRNSIDLKKVRVDHDPGKLMQSILKKAFKAEGVATNVNDIHDLLCWAMGDNYPCIPYQKWGDTIMEKHPECTVPENVKDTVPIYVMMRMVARLWKTKGRKYFSMGVH